MKKYFLTLLMMLICLTNTQNINAAPKINNKSLKIKQAKALVFMSLRPEENKLPALTIENGVAKSYRDPNFPRFLFFIVTWAGPPTGGSISVGSYDVDPYTGDVFYATSTCLEVKNRQLKSLQKKYRHTILHLSYKKYKKIKTKGPMCDE